MEESAGWRDHIRSRADTPLADRLIRLVDRLRAEQGVVPRASDGSRRDYLSLYPPTGGRGRVGAITIGSGRFYGFFTPARRDALAHQVPLSEPAEGKYLTRYVRTDADIEVAVHLIDLALRERGIAARPRTAPARPALSASPETPTIPTAPDQTEALRAPATDARSTDRQAPSGSSDHAESTVVLHPRALERAARVTTSAAYLEGASRFGRRAPEPDRVERVLAVLLMDRAPVGFARVATVTRMPAGRVPGFLAVLVRLLTVDGVPVITVDTDAQEVRLDRNLLAAQFPE